MEDRGSVTPSKKELQLGPNARERRTLQMVGRWDVSAEDARELLDAVERQQSAHTLRFWTEDDLPKPRVHDCRSIMSKRGLTCCG